MTPHPAVDLKGGPKCRAQRGFMARRDQGPAGFHTLFRNPEGTLWEMLTLEDSEDQLRAADPMTNPGQVNARRHRV